MPQSVKCHHCSKTFEEHKILYCCICKKGFNHGCLDVSAAEVRTIRSKRGLSWNCDGCSTVGSDLNQLRSAIVALTEELTKVKTKLNSLDTFLGKDDALFEDLLQEFREREERRPNLIVYGVSDDAGRSSADRRSHDNDFCSNLLTHLSIDGMVSSTRLGKLDDTRTSSRPIRVVLDSEKTVFKAINNFRDLKKNNLEYNTVSLSFDRTPRQVAYYKSVRMELERRTQEGDKLRIKYIKGVPKLVPLN